MAQAGNVLVAAADGDETVEAFRTHHGLDGIGDDFARDQRIAHAGRAHRDAVGNRDGVEQHALAARGIGSCRGFARQHVDVHVAWRDIGPGGCDAHLRLAEVRVGEAHGPQHRARRCILEPVDHEAGMHARDLVVLLRVISFRFLFLRYFIRVEADGPGQRQCDRQQQRKAPGARTACRSRAV